MVNSCLECLIGCYQVHVWPTSVVLQIFQLLCLADVNKAIKYERPGDCLAQDIKSFDEKIAPPWRYQMSPIVQTPYIEQRSARKKRLFPKRIIFQPFTHILINLSLIWHKHLTFDEINECLIKLIKYGKSFNYYIIWNNALISTEVTINK